MSLIKWFKIQILLTDTNLTSTKTTKLQYYDNVAAVHVKRISIEQFFHMDSKCGLIANAIDDFPIYMSNKCESECQFLQLIIIVTF